MLTLNALHSQLDEALNVNNSDSIFDPLYYTDLINEQRILSFRNEYNRKRVIDPNIIQTISCLELEEVSKIQCCQDIPIGCKILRTKRKIPNTLELFYKKGITSVGPSDITKKRFTIIDYSRVPYVGNGRTTKNSIFTYLYDGYLYIFSKAKDLSLLSFITIQGVFEDPTELSNFTSCDDNNCFTDDSIYPMNLWTWAYIKPQVLQQLMQKLQVPVDVDNDGDNLNPPNTGK